MEIRNIETSKKQYLPLLLLADEQEDMIDRYLERGVMYVLEDDGVKAACVVTDEGNGILELKNIAVAPDFQRKGYGKALVAFLFQMYNGQYEVLQVGTGDSPSTIHFTKPAGFAGITWSRISSSITMTIPFMNAAFSWSIWYIYNGSCDAIAPISSSCAKKFWAIADLTCCPESFLRPKLPR